MKTRLFLIAIGVLISLHAVLAQNKSYQTQRTDTPPRIDGMFDDLAWNAQEWENNFTQFEPENGAAPSQRTGFKILYDDNHLYVAIKCFDDEPEKIERRLTRRDGFDGEIAGVHIDSYFDKRSAFGFMVNASGVKNDGFFSEDGENFDESWDPIWEVKTKINAEGWNAEMKIPLSQLRFGNQVKQVWGLQVARSIYRTEEIVLWKHIERDASGWVSHYGEMHGIEHLKPKRQVEIAPFTVVKSESYEEEEGNPYADGSDFGFDAGVDGKIGLTNDLILDFAINPDFGQVEADPSEVNLSAFETFFEEKRPFFIEGNNITNFQLTPGDSPFSSDKLFYSRRIGRSPSYYPDLEDDEFIDWKSHTRILGAFKVTGKTKNGWSIGVIESVTPETKAEIDYFGEKRELVIEPLTNYFVSRLQKDINKGNTLIGGMFTSTHRKINDQDLNFLPESAISGGVDFTQYFKEKKYFVSASLAASKVMGDEEAILELQESSRHLFQRPDADYLELDPKATSMSGTGGTLLLGKNANSGLRYLFNYTFRSPGLELNDVGFMRQGNTSLQFIWVGYSIDKPFSIFRSINISVNQWAGWDFGGYNLFSGGNINLNMDFKNFWSFRGGINREGANISNTELRGGPSIHLPGSWNWSARISTNSRKKLQISAGMHTSKGDDGYYTFATYFGELTYRPINTLSISVEPDFNVIKSELQYVDEQFFEGDPRYIFGNLDQKTFNVTARVDFNITPDLTIQYYGSPFVSGVSYADFKKITDPKADAFSSRYQSFAQNQLSYNSEEEVYGIHEAGSGAPDYYFDKPDMNFRQFRSNLVLRWEYVPGSVVYLVWSQGRSDSVSDGHFDFSNDLKDLFKTTPHDIFLLKLSYRFRAEKWF